MTVTVNLGNDDVYEIEEYFSGLLETTDPGVELFNEMANATIVDDDGEYPTLLKMGRYCSTSMCHYWDMSVK